MTTEPHRPNWWQVAQFVAGATILAHETLLTNAERPFLISAAVALMGLPFVLASERRNGKNGGAK